MAKDPAVLWYWNDWQGGTSTFTRHLKGCYMDLLNAQFNSGRLSLAEIKTILGADYGQAWPTLQKKFATDESGLFFNERMEEEKNKRKVFTESRRKNLQAKKIPHKDAHVGVHMAPHMDNENGDGIVIKEGGLGEGWVTMPGKEQMDLSLPDLKVGAIIEYFKISKNVDITDGQVLSLWRIFKVQSFTGKKYYGYPSDAHSHFFNWSIQKNVKDIPPDLKRGSELSIRERQGEELLKSINGPNK